MLNWLRGRKRGPGGPSVRTAWTKPLRSMPMVVAAVQPPVAHSTETAAEPVGAVGEVELLVG